MGKIFIEGKNIRYEDLGEESLEKGDYENFFFDNCDLKGAVFVEQIFKKPT